MQTQRLLPRVSIRVMFFGMTLATVLAVVASLAVAGNSWARMLLMALAWIVVALVFYAVAFFVAYGLALLRPSSNRPNDEMNPFELEGELPPQFIVPEDPE